MLDKALLALLVFVSLSCAQITATLRVVPAGAFVEQTTLPRSPALVGEQVTFYCDYFSEVSGARVPNAECTVYLDGQAIRESGERNSVQLEGLKVGSHLWKCTCFAPNYEPSTGQQQLLSIESSDSKNPLLASNLIEDAEKKIAASKNGAAAALKAEEQLAIAVAAFEKQDYATANKLALSSIRLSSQPANAQPFFPVSIEMVSTLIFIVLALLALVIASLAFVFKK